MNKLLTARFFHSSIVFPPFLITFYGGKKTKLLYFRFLKLCLICNLTHMFVFILQGLLLCILYTIVTAQQQQQRERHSREHQHKHHHQHRHRQHQQQLNLINQQNVHGNRTFGSGGGGGGGAGHAWLSQPDAAENELEKRGKNGWSAWTNWSTCSRSCDGGIAQQIRRCHSTHCRGEPIRYRICNMQVNNWKFIILLYISFLLPFGLVFQFLFK